MRGQGVAPLRRRRPRRRLRNPGGRPGAKTCQPRAPVQTSSPISSTKLAGSLAALSSTTGSEPACSVWSVGSEIIQLIEEVGKVEHEKKEMWLNVWPSLVCGGDRRWRARPEPERRPRKHIC